MKYINMSENNETEVLAKTDASPDQTMRYVSYVVMVLVLCALIYFAYKKFNANKSDSSADDEDDCDESGKRVKKDGGGGNAAGYDVHAAVSEIEAMQSRVMNKVSTNVTV
jgi:cbb3-type cytochrome oxidase subunit 3